MADVIEAAPTGRAKCRGCGRGIAKGELRFGESLPNPYAEGETLYWFHPTCAACMRPEKALPAFEAATVPLPDAEWLTETAKAGIEHRRLPRLLRVERASSGRAHCRQCRELIEKGAFRFVLQMFEEGRMSPIGTIHVACAEAYFGTKDVMGRLRRLAPDVPADELAEVERLLAEAPPATGEQVRLAKTRPEPKDEADSAGAPEPEEKRSAS